MYYKYNEYRISETADWTLACRALNHVYISGQCELPCENTHYRFTGNHIQI